jgi:hypothetical protein
MVYGESESNSIEDISNVGALIGLALGLGMVAIGLVRLCKNKPEWRGKRRSLSIASLVFLIAFVVLFGWTLITN